MNNRNISSNRASVNTEQRLIFDNHEINSNSFILVGPPLSGKSFLIGLV